MYETSEKVTLTNAIDKSLVRRGQLAAREVRRVTVDAVINTDLVRSMISKRVADILGVGIRGGRASGPILFEYLGGQTIDEAVVGEGQVIIGLTVVSKITNPGRIKPKLLPIE